MIMKTREISFSVALFLATFCCVHSEENVKGMSDATSVDASSDPSVHLAKKRSASPAIPDEIDDSLMLDPDYPLDDDEDLDKRSSLFRFGKRQGSMLRYGKRQFRYGKRQFRYGKRQVGKRQGSLFRFGKRGSLFRFGKRGGGTLFRFGRSSGPSSYDDSELEEKQELLRQLLEAYYARQAEGYGDEQEMAKREGFHWGSDE